MARHTAVAFIARGDFCNRTVALSGTTNHRKTESTTVESAEDRLRRSAIIEPALLPEAGINARSAVVYKVRFFSGPVESMYMALQRTSATIRVMDRRSRL